MQMHPRLHFVSLDEGFIEEVSRLFRCEEGVTWCKGKVEDEDRRGRAFVSPANSLLFMDGGIDYAYSRVMFPGVEGRLKEMVRLGRKVTQLGRPYLPVGSAVIVPVAEATLLIAAPTMFLPHDVSMTQNAYHACMAALLALRKYRAKNRGTPIDTLVLTGFCCGYGKMPAATSAAQMYAAYKDYQRGLVPSETEQLHDRIVLLPSRDLEQPDNYDNREIKELHRGV